MAAAVLGFWIGCNARAPVPSAPAAGQPSPGEGSSAEPTPSGPRREQPPRSGLDLYEWRISRAGITLEGAELATDPVTLGASSGRAYRAGGGEVEVQLFLFGHQGEHAAALERLRATDWSQGHDFAWSSNGSVLFVGRTPLGSARAGANRDALRRLGEAFAGEE